MKKIIALILLFFPLAYLHSQDYNDVHKLITEGINSVYEIDFPTALSKFQEAKKIAPNDLRGPFFESTVYFWKALFTRNRTDYEQYLNLSDNLVKKCENAIDKNENDLDAQFYMGWSYTLRAFIVYMMDQKFLQAANDIKSGNNALKFVVEKNPNYYDAYLGLGIFNYMTSMIPKKLQWLTSILGYSGDRDEGKKQLTIASDKGVYTSNEAKFYLTLLTWREENYTAAEGYATQLKNSFPQSPAVWMLWGGLLSQQDKMNEAIDAYEKSVQLNKGKESDALYKNAYGALSNAYFKTNNFVKAADYGKKYISYVNKDDNINNRLYSIGVSLELMGNRNDALSYYRQARTDFKEDNEWEKFYLRKLNERAAEAITPVDSALIIASNNVSVGKSEDAISQYQKLLSDNTGRLNDDISAQINNGMGAAYFKEKNYDKAIEQFRLNYNLKPVRENWLVPEAYFQTGRCLLRLGRKSEAQQYFDKALDIDYDYDFKNAMDSKVKNELTKF